MTVTVRIISVVAVAVVVVVVVMSLWERHKYIRARQEVARLGLLYKGNRFK